MQLRVRFPGRDACIRGLAVLATAAVLLVQVYGWISWKVTRDVMQAFQRSVQEAAARGDSAAARAP